MHLRLGLAVELLRHVAHASPRRGDGPGRRDARHGGDAVQPQRDRLRARHVPRPRRHGRDHPGVRGTHRAARVLRRRDPADHATRPGERASDPRGVGDHHLPGLALHHAGGADQEGAGGDRGGAGRATRRAARGEQAPRGPAARAADEVRPRDDRADGLLLRHRELLAASRRAAPGPASVRAARLLPAGLPARHRRVPPDRAADSRNVPRRPLSQDDARRLRVPASVGARQPAAHVHGVRGARRPGGVHVCHTGSVRGEAEPARRRAGHPPDRSGGPRGRDSAGQGPGRRPHGRDSQGSSSAAIACW